MTKVARVTGTRTTAGSGAPVIAAPAPNQEVLIYYTQVQAQDATPVTVLLKAGSNIEDRVRCAVDGGGKMREYTDNNCIRCGAGNEVYLDLDVNALIGYVIEYRIVGVG